MLQKLKQLRYSDKYESIAGPYPDNYGCSQGKDCEDWKTSLNVRTVKEEDWFISCIILLWFPWRDGPFLVHCRAIMEAYVCVTTFCLLVSLKQALHL